MTSLPDETGRRICNAAGVTRPLIRLVWGGQLLRQQNTHSKLRQRESSRYSVGLHRLSPACDSMTLVCQSTTLFAIHRAAVSTANVACQYHRCRVLSLLHGQRRLWTLHVNWLALRQCKTMASGSSNPQTPFHDSQKRYAGLVVPHISVSCVRICHRHHVLVRPYARELLQLRSHVAGLVVLETVVVCES